MAIHSTELGKVLLDALGITDRVRWFELRCHVDEVATIRCEILPDNYDGDKIKSVLQKYAIEPRKEETNVDP